MATMKWNNDVKLIVSDVDETIADVYTNAEPKMIIELERLLSEEKILFLISGQCIKNIQERISNHIKPELRKQIIIGHCSGVEVCGFDNNGKLRKKPFYSLYESALTDKQKMIWRQIIKQLILEFKLITYPTMPVPEFRKKSKATPLAVMFEDRGAQITLEVVNAYNLSSKKAEYLEKLLKIKIPRIHGEHDLRIPIIKRAEQLLTKAGIPITPRMAGVFAIDFAIKGVSKTTAVKYIIGHGSILRELGIPEKLKPSNIEIWGDKFSTIRGGTDRHISKALAKSVRSITFRKENPEELPEGFNIAIWNGKKHLHKGLLEFLRSR